MPINQGLELEACKSKAIDKQSESIDGNKRASEKLLREAYCIDCTYSRLSDRDKAESAADQLLRIMMMQNSASVFAYQTGDGMTVDVGIGREKNQANKLVEEMKNAGYPLKVMFGSGFDRRSDIEAYEAAQPTPGMTKIQALQFIQSFLLHPDSFQHREDIAKTWTYVRCHPANDPVACPEGPVSSAFRGAYLELSGGLGELTHQDYAKLNSALKVLEAHGDIISVQFN